MPKQTQELRSFNVGTILSPDTTDIPIEAASYSLDVDSVTEDGKLKGRPGDLGLTILNSAENPVLISPAEGGISYVLIDNVERLVIFNGTEWVLASTDINATYNINGVEFSNPEEV